MLYLSQVQNQRIWDAFGRSVGRCKDVLIGHVDRPFPPALALAVADGDTAPRLISSDQVASLFPSIILSVSLDKLKTYEPRGDELWLVDRILDRQIVDTEGRRVVRVNDVQLARVDNQFRVTGVDVAGRGLLRRLGVERPVDAITQIVGKSLPEGVIPWKDVAHLAEEDSLHLRVSRDKISQLPPADIAAILDDIDQPTTQALLGGMEDQVLADALEESPMEVQIAVLSQLVPERAADILEEMDPDEAADLLADLPEETSSNLLELMEEKDAADVLTLLGYPEDSAGGIMTTEFACVPTGLSVAEALDFLRHSEDAREDETMHYVYFLNESRRLQHVMTLRDLVMASPGQDIEDLTSPAHSPVTVNPMTSQQEVAYLVAKYDLLAIPVVDEETQEMLGIVTVDDALDVVLPTAWKKRLPRFS